MRYSSQHKAETRVRLLKSAAVVAMQSGLAAPALIALPPLQGICGSPSGHSSAGAPSKEISRALGELTTD